MRGPPLQLAHGLPTCLGTEGRTPSGSVNFVTFVLTTEISMLKNRAFAALALAGLVSLAACEAEEETQVLEEPIVEEPVVAPVEPAPVTPDTGMMADTIATDPAL